MVPLSARDSECVDIVKTDTYSEQLSSHGAAATSGAQSLASVDLELKLKHMTVRALFDGHERRGEGAGKHREYKFSGEGCHRESRIRGDWE